jgi:hypothetical protein
MNQIVCVNTIIDPIGSDGKRLWEGNQFVEGLTINKVYKVEKWDKTLTDAVYIINDLGNLEGYFMSDFFITIDKWREQQLNKIL